jgi:nitrogen regulatory protein P-II 1
MKYIIAIIRSHKLLEVKRELEKNEIHLLTVSDVLGCGRQKGVTEIYRGVTEIDNLLRKTKIEIAVNDEYLEPAVNAIMKAAPEKEVGDGKIFIFDMKGVHKNTHR